MMEAVLLVGTQDQPPTIGHAMGETHAKLAAQTSRGHCNIIVLAMPWRMHGDRLRWFIEDIGDEIVFYDFSMAAKVGDTWQESAPGREAHGFCDVLSNPASIW